LVIGITDVIEGLLVTNEPFDGWPDRHGRDVSVRAGWHSVSRSIGSASL
jgi:hypothetical protein